MEDKFTYMNALLDFYQPMLSQRQQEILMNYYGEDLSLSEIADNLNISRNAVYDALKKAEEKLSELEETLHLYADYRYRSEKYEQLREAGDEDIKKIVDELIRYEEGQ